MSINYKPLWVELAKRDMKKKDLKIKANISDCCIATMGNNKYISMKNIEKICIALDIEPNQVFEITKGEDDERK